MARNIKITEKQYRKLMETSENDFSYITDNDTKYCDGSVVSASGKKETGKNGKPVIADEIQMSLTPQTWNRYRTYGNITPRQMSEGVSVGNDSNQADDTGEVNANFNSTNKELNTLTNNDTKDNLVKIPQGIQNKINILLDEINRSHLSPKQKAIVLNKLIEELNTDSTPYRIQRKWKNDIRNNKKISNQWKNELENEAD